VRVTRAPRDVRRFALSIYSPVKPRMGVKAYPRGAPGSTARCIGPQDELLSLVGFPREAVEGRGAGIV